MRKKTGIALAAVLALLLFFKWAEVLEVMTALLGAGGIALILAPLCTKLEGKGLSANAAAGLSVLILLLVLLLLLAVFIPYLVMQSVGLFRRLAPLMSTGASAAAQWVRRFGMEALPVDQLAGWAAGLLPGITAGAAKSGVVVAGVAGKLVFALVIAFYLLCERDNLSKHLLLFVPAGYRSVVLASLMGCKSAVLGYLSGVLKTSIFVGSATFIGLFLVGIRDALLLSVFMGLLEILPYIGPILAAVPIVLSALTQGLGRAAMALGVVLIVQQIEGSFISPYFTAASTSVSPLLSLLVVFALGSLWGLWGILLAVPMLVTARSIWWSAGQIRNIEICRQEMIET